MTIGERIRMARKKKGLTQEELASQLGYKSKSSVAHIENGRDIPRSMVVRLAEILDTTPAYLMGWEEDAKEDTQSVSIKDAIPFDPDRMRAFPVLGKVSAGMGSFTDPDNMIGTMTTDIDGLIEDYDYVWLRVEGDSMEPELLDGDYVLVRVQETAETGDLSVVLVDNESGVVKRIDYEEQNHITLISNNPRYAPRVFVREEMNRVRIFGKVVKMSRCF